MYIPDHLGMRLLVLWRFRLNQQCHHTDEWALSRHRWNGQTGWSQWAKARDSNLFPHHSYLATVNTTPRVCHTDTHRVCSQVCLDGCNPWISLFIGRSYHVEGAGAVLRASHRECLAAECFCHALFRQQLLIQQQSHVKVNTHGLRYTYNYASSNYQWTYQQK